MNGRLVAAPAAMRSALLLPLAAGLERELERWPRRSLTWPVVHKVEIDRLGRRSAHDSQRGWRLGHKGATVVALLVLYAVVPIRIATVAARRAVVPSSV
jgi:hypothetical protein